MAFTSVTNTFSAGAIIVSADVNTNFTDIINGLSDGTKDISVNNGTFAGTLAITGISSFTGVIRATDGASTAPAFSFTSETTLGLWRNAAATLDLVSAAASIFRVTSTSGTSNVSIAAVSKASGSGDAFFTAYESGDTTNAWIWGRDDTSGDFSLCKGTALGTNEYINIDTSGLLTFGASGGTQSHIIYGYFQISNGGASGAHLQLTNTTTEDCYVRLNANSTNWWSLGLDYSATQAFKIGIGADLTTSTVFTISAAGLFTIGASGGTQAHVTHGSQQISRNAGIGVSSGLNAGIEFRVTSDASGFLTGASQRAVYVDTAFTSAATTLGDVIVSVPTTANASFTTPIVRAFYAASASKGASNTITRLTNFYGETQTAGTNNAFIADNNSYSGNYFINSTSTNASVLTGNLTVNANVDAQIITSDLAYSTTVNLGITYSSSTLTITDAAGSALSSSNPGYVVLPSTTTGQLILLKLTAAQSFVDDGGSSSFSGHHFGTESGIGWAQDAPFYIYAVNGDNTDANCIIAISRCPTFNRSPQGTYISYKGVAAGTRSPYEMFFLTTTDVTSSHASKPCKLIGGLTMQKTGTGGDWTVQSFSSAYGDGITTTPFRQKTWIMPADHYSGSNGFIYSSGTEPTWASGDGSYRYHIGLDGFCTVAFSTSGQGNCTNGVGGGTLNIILPYWIDWTFHSQFHHCGFAIINGAYTNLQMSVSGSQAIQSLYSDLTLLTDTAFASTSDDLNVHTRFKAFETTI